MIKIDIIDEGLIVNLGITTREKAVDFIKKLGFDLYSMIVYKSPVDTGRFRMNWGIGFTSDAAGTNNVQILNTYPSSLPDIFITNNLPYSEVIENGMFTRKPETPKTIGGYSKQAPHGVIKPSLSEITAWLQS